MCREIMTHTCLPRSISKANSRRLQLFFTPSQIFNPPSVFRPASICLNSANFHLRTVFAERLIMGQFSTLELVDSETCPNASCKFSNISGAKNCEKCGTALAGGTQRSVFSHSTMSSNAERLGPCNASGAFASQRIRL